MSIPFVAAHYAAGAADGSDTDVVLAPNPDRSWLLHGLKFSYDSTPTGGGLTIIDDAGSPNTLWQVDIPASGPYVIEFDPPREWRRNTGLTITLAGGGGTVRGRLGVDASTQL